MKRASPLVIFVASLALALLPVASAWAAETSAPHSPSITQHHDPRWPIKRFDAMLLQTMKQAKMLGYAGRYRRLAPEIRQLFDFHTIAMLSMGNYWDKLSPAQQHTLEATMRHYTIATYAARFDGYSGESFSIKSSAPLSSQVSVVYSTLLEREGKSHDFDYLLHPVDGHWRVINVVADGVSDLSVKRAEFAHVMKTKGFTGLIHRLNRHIVRMAHGQ
ncbi:MAG: ABC transporter substrate-binding protein [Acidiferrobacteraceae bacterium]